MSEVHPINPSAETLGDMDLEEFRHHAHRVVDWIADYLKNNGRYPVLAQVAPGDLKAALPDRAPATGEPMEDMLADIDRFVLPGVTHWNHPAFFAYFAISGSAPGILGEMFAAAFNVNAMLWRTSPSATELEEVTIGWVRQLIGLPEQFSGVVYDTASTSTLCAIAAAREAVPGLDVREQGLAAPDASGKPARLRLYCSEHAHSSVDKAAITLGLGHRAVRKIACDDEFRMKPDELARAIEEDREAGWTPFCVVATTGTTSTTSIDPVAEIAPICERERLWLHVDAAYGGSAAIAPEFRWVLAGAERADSIVINPHKWMFVPIDFSILFTRHMDVLRGAFSLVPEYLRAAETGEVHNYMDYGPQLGRRFRAIKMWFVMRYFGAEGIAARIRNHVAMAQEFAGWVRDSRDFELMAPAPLSVVCFRARPAGSNLSEEELDQLNERLMATVNQRGKVFLSHTKLNNRFTLRLAIGNIRTTRDHVRLAWEELNQVVAPLRGADVGC